MKVIGSVKEDLNLEKRNSVSPETVKKFIEEVYEIAFGEDAINKDWHPDAVIEELSSFSDKALEFDERDY